MNKIEIKKNFDKNDYALYIPESLAYKEYDMDFGLYISFSKENLERIFKESGYDVTFPEIPNNTLLVTDLGVFSFNVLEDGFARNMKLLVIKV
jgi:hypothetical protein